MYDEICNVQPYMSEKGLIIIEDTHAVSKPIFEDIAEELIEKEAKTLKFKKQHPEHEPEVGIIRL
jgi:hypothetical protein